jgi:hypothetical protein
MARASRKSSAHPPAVPAKPGRAWLAGATGSFPVRVALWYFLALGLWWPLGSYYREILVGVGNVVVGALPLGGELSIVPYTEPEKDGMTDRVDLAVLVRKPGWVDGRGQKQHVLAKAVATFYQPYMATAFLVALFLSTHWLPGPARALRGLAAAGWLYLFMLLCVAIDARFTLAGYGGPASMAWDWSRTAVSLLHFSITDWPAGVLFVPLVLWALHVWTPGSLRELRRSEVDAAPVPTLHVHAKKP